jgi:hypothetical protein
MQARAFASECLCHDIDSVGSLRGVKTHASHRLGHDGFIAAMVSFTLKPATEKFPIASAACDAENDVVAPSCLAVLSRSWNSAPVALVCDKDAHATVIVSDAFRHSPV